MIVSSAKKIAQFFLFSNETLLAFQICQFLGRSRSHKVKNSKSVKFRTMTSKMTFLGSIRLDTIVLSLIIPIFTKRSEVTKYQKFWSKIRLMQCQMSKIFKIIRIFGQNLVSEIFLGLKFKQIKFEI